MYALFLGLANLALSGFFAWLTYGVLTSNPTTAGLALAGLCALGSVGTLSIAAGVLCS